MFRSNHGGMCCDGECGPCGRPMSKEFETALLAEKERMLEDALKSVRELKKSMEEEPAPAK